MNSEHNKLKYFSWFLTKPRTTGFFAFFFLSTIVGYISYQQYKIVKDEERVTMSNTLQVIHQNIEQSLKNSYTSTLTLALTVNDEGIPENFDNIGAKLVASNRSISTVQLVPKGVIKYIYPEKGNESAMGLNILKRDYLRKEALKSIQNQKMYFAGPINLQQGGVGIVGRLPVFQHSKFWGFSAVIIKLEDLLKNSGAYNIDSTKYYFQFSKINPTTQKEVFYLPKQNEFSKNYSVAILIPDGDWKIQLTAKNQNFLYPQILVPSIFGLLFAALFGFIITLILKKPAELQLLVEEQTANFVNSEIKFKTIFDQAAIGIANVNNKTGMFIEINNHFCKMLGYSQNEIKFKNFQSITHPDDLQEILENVEKLEKGIISGYSMEKRYFTKKGNILWVRLNVTPLLNQNKKQISSIAIVEDISLKKEAEELLQKSEIRFKSLFNDSPLQLWVEDYSAVKKYLSRLNLIGEDPEKVSKYLKQHPDVVKKAFSLVKIIDVNNQSLLQFVPKTKSEILNDISLIITDESIPSFRKNIEAICMGKHQMEMDTKMKNLKDEIKDIHIIYSVMKGYEDSLERVIISSEDITARKIAEKNIIDSQKRTESLINTIDGIVWESDIDTFSFSFISEKVKDILGYNPEEWIASPTFWSDHIYPEDKETAIDYCIIQTSRSLNHDFEYRMIAKNGSIVWVKNIVTIVFENDKACGLRGIMIDITQNKEAEQNLKDSFNVVTEQNKRLLNFSYIVSHNLRSHTSNIASIMSLIETSDSEQEKDDMLLLLKSVSNSLNETMLHLNEVINIRNNIGLVSESLNLNQYLNSAQNALSEQISTNQVSILNEIPDDVIVKYNPAYLESVLHNIISNSIRYRHPDRIPVITIKWLIEDKRKLLIISDNGIGIDLVKNGNKIFGMYKTFSNNPESKGIGLFITKNQIDAMNGSITVESTPNIGTTFKIYIR